MEINKYRVVLSIVMVITGSINTLSTKWADNLSAVGKDGGTARKYNHPLIQSCFMFLGEFLCLIVFQILYLIYTRRQVIVEDISYIRGNQNFNPLIFLIPAMCDMTATTMMYIGLVLTYASSFQMLRGASIVFVALLSSAFVEREIKRRHWAGIFLIVTGLSVVGFADFSSNSTLQDTNSVITGDLLIVIAQVVGACQMVYEEKYVVSKDIPPLKAVGLEGIFGLLVLSILLIPASYLYVGQAFSSNPGHTLEDVSDAFIQMWNNKWILIASLGTMISIAFFNFAGISVTKEVSATTRIILDTVRTFFVWMICLALHWQDFHWLQLLGFALLFAGMCVYYNILPRSIAEREEDDLLINQQADET